MQLDLFRPVLVSVDGMTDPKEPRIRYIGKAALQPNGKYHCLAILGEQVLASVEVTIRFD